MTNGIFKITAENWDILIQNERDMNIACTNFTKAFLYISELCIPKRASLVGRSLLSNILIVL
jgi:hypothetical protein